MRLLALVALAAVAFGQNNTDTAAAPASTAVAATGSVQPTGSAQPSAPASTTTPPADLANAVAPKTTSKRPFPTTSYPPPPPNPPAPPPLEQSSIWSYPLPPLPARTASAPNSAFTVTESIPPLFGGKTRKYTFNLGYSAGRPSGFKRRLATVNNQFPGPLIEAWQGDTVEVTVINNLDYPQGIHWHGIVQKDTPWQDGVPGISQCSIQPGHSYTYRFKLVDEVGTFWWHSHQGNTMADGLFGAFVVHSKNDPLKKSTLLTRGDFDDDKVLLTGDWWHDESAYIVSRLFKWGVGYRGSNLPRMPDAVLLNGAGQEDCNLAQGDADCDFNTPSETRARMGSKLRLRLINHGSLSQLRFSIDNHVLKVVEVDDTPIQPLFLTEVPIDAGQRVSVIVNLNQGGLFSYPAFWMRSSISSACMVGGYKLEGLAILRYTDLLGIAWSGKRLPTTAAWPTNKDPLKAPCLDLDDEHSVVPLIPENPPANTFSVWRMDSSAGQFVNPWGDKWLGFGFNPYLKEVPQGAVSFTNFINDPILAKIENGLELNHSRVAAVTLDQVGAADIIINQRDLGLAHPFHLHGRKFYIMARGHGLLTEADYPNVKLNLNNPLRRDTLTIGTNSWAIIRLVTDTPGVWPLHCHLGWHLSAGKLALIVVRPDEVRKFQKPAEWLGLCKGLDPNEIGPARRAIPPQARNSIEDFYGLHKRQNETETDTTPANLVNYDSPNGKNVPYFSMDRTQYTLIADGYTVTQTFTISETQAPPFALPTSVDTAAASSAYATQTNRPPDALWSADGPLPDDVKATEGVPLPVVTKK